MADRVYRGEIYYIHETEIHGNEQSGGRPGIVISNDIGNEHSPVAIIVYLTTQEKKPLPTHVKISTASKPSIALCEQIETVYKARIGNYIGQITDEEQKYLDKALAVSIGLGLTIKTNKAVEKWAEVYVNEVNSTMVCAIEKAELPECLQEIEKSKRTVLVESEGLEFSSKMLIRIEAERDIYKELYQGLLRRTFDTEK